MEKADDILREARSMLGDHDVETVDVSEALRLAREYLANEVQDLPTVEEVVEDEENDDDKEDDQLELFSRQMLESGEEMERAFAALKLPPTEHKEALLRLLETEKSPEVLSSALTNLAMNAVTDASAAARKLLTHTNATVRDDAKRLLSMVQPKKKIPIEEPPPLPEAVEDNKPNLTADVEKLLQETKDLVNDKDNSIDDALVQALIDSCDDIPEDDPDNIIAFWDNLRTKHQGTCSSSSGKKKKESLTKQKPPTKKTPSSSSASSSSSSSKSESTSPLRRRPGSSSEEKKKKKTLRSSSSLPAINASVAEDRSRSSTA